MTDSNSPEVADESNDHSLKTLIRAITLSSGRRFSLILVRCNYERLQQDMLQRLREECPMEIRELVLPRSARTLYTAIQTEFGDDQLSALTVLGLEKVADLDDLLLATNQVRDEFPKSFKFPLVLWVTDEVLKKLVRLAPDFHNWAATPISFFLPTEKLIDLLRQGADSTFAKILDTSADSLSGNWVIDLESGSCRRQELELARRDLQDQGQVLEPDLEASLDFVFGWDDYKHNQIDDAVQKYQQSLAFWRQTGNLERQGVLRFHLGRCYLRKAELNRAENQRHWEEARHYFQECVDVFEQAQRLELVAKFIDQLGEVLQYLKKSDELQALAQKSLELHQTYSSPLQLARDYGFLAEVALARSNWVEAERLAQQAIQVLAEVPQNQRSRQGLYLLLLAKGQQKNQPQEAIKNLKIARDKSKPQDDPPLYIRILEALQKLYYEQKQYLKAFEIKQYQWSIEGQYGFRAFVGAACLQPLPRENQDTVAPEIEASGRQQDVVRLIERVTRNDYKLTVIHGQSGVGKSSTINAGLIPALKQKTIETRDVLPISLRFYTNWEGGLGQLLADALEEKGKSLPKPLNSAAAIIEELKRNEERNLLTVLIFDQFEEFFFDCTERAARRPFFEFLSDCLNIPYVKVILSLREDYLHYLLECERLAKLDVVNNDILSKRNRYELGNFSPKDAESIIRRLTERSQFSLEPALVDELVRDLAQDSGEVRPIELQIVGAQLQTESITQLEQYHECGLKAQLVQRYVEAIIKDCGEENQRAAELVLYLLTDEKNHRPLKTRTELEKDFKEKLTAELTAESDNLDLVLKIFVISGLVLLLPELPANRYQLVHDYLVELIRQQRQKREAELIAKLGKEQEQREEAETQRDRLKAVSLRIVRDAKIIILISPILIIVIFGFAFFQKILTMKNHPKKPLENQNLIK